MPVRLSEYIIEAHAGRNFPKNWQQGLLWKSVDKSKFRQKSLALRTKTEVTEYFRRYKFAIKALLYKILYFRVLDSDI